MTEVHSIADDLLATDRPAGASDPAIALAATIVSRICHDLVSPLGALANGVELLALSGEEPSPEMQLIAQSVESANARVRFFRLAYGACSDQVVGRSELSRLLASMSRSGRIAYDWPLTVEQPRRIVQVMFLVFQCLESALPAGGRIVVRPRGSRWEVTADGPRLRLNPTAWDCLGLPRTPPPAGPSLVQFGLLATALADSRRQIEFDFGPDRIVARF
ncbi:histidine phosphotransferase family protein [Rubellimicrobium roseum]|uniref:Histidine phosphotransferase n=1 Tax=Rubellimicrobium roseum TaxID=687525 RepID=A0A5C4NDP0_9RHOB|nr:histidine phosphotransferase family protein [Rubellimicrobium roseum]TNC72000.1 histidine phosphotransferase [Rubellimicrobium roseum]